nr:VP1 [Sicinivirus A]
GDTVAPADPSPDDGINALEQVRASGPPSMQIAPYFDMFTKAWMKPLAPPESDDASTELAEGDDGCPPIKAYLTEKLSLPHTIELRPSVWSMSVGSRRTSSLATQAIASCYYFRADLDIEIMLTIPAVTFTATTSYPAIGIQYYPPGGTIIQAQECASSIAFNAPTAAVYATAFPRLPAPGSSTASSQAVTYHLNLTVPYTGINPMVPTVYSGTTEAITPEHARSPMSIPDSLGRLYIYYLRDESTNPDFLCGDMRIRLRNFTPAVARLPQLAFAYSVADFSEAQASPLVTVPPVSINAELLPNPLVPSNITPALQ